MCSTLVINRSVSTSALCLRQSKPTPSAPLSQEGGGFSTGHEALACSCGNRRGQNTRQISGVRPHVLRVAPPIKVTKKSKLFPSCGSVERCDSCNTRVAERYKTLKHGGGGEGRMKTAQVYKNRKLHLQLTHSAEPANLRSTCI